MPDRSAGPCVLEEKRERRGVRQRDHDRRPAPPATTLGQDNTRVRPFGFGSGSPEPRRGATGATNQLSLVIFLGCRDRAHSGAVRCRAWRPDRAAPRVCGRPRTEPVGHRRQRSMANVRERPPASHCGRAGRSHPQAGGDGDLQERACRRLHARGRTCDPRRRSISTSATCCSSSAISRRRVSTTCTCRGKRTRVHNGIFLVNDADRKRLDPPTSVGRLVDQEWHRVRLVRAAANGQIQVFFDADPKPVSVDCRRHAAQRSRGCGFVRRDGRVQTTCPELEALSVTRGQSHFVTGDRPR